jgi:hypothetical protein
LNLVLEIICKIFEKKEQIAFAQCYFSMQTRKQALLEERFRLNEQLQAREKLAAKETELSKNILRKVCTIRVLQTFAVKMTGHYLEV